MATVREILTKKGQQVLSIGSRESSLDAAMLMNRHKVGSLLVMDGQSVVGIITRARSSGAQFWRSVGIRPKLRSRRS